MTVTRPRAERGAFPPGTEHYGRSLLGAPLIWFPAPAASRESGLILAGTHGDENSSVVTLSCALRTLTPSLRRHHVVLCVNPDGCQLGLRANANGVDLNRNFPAANWKEGETVYRWNSAAEERDVVLLTGDKPGCAGILKMQFARRELKRRFHIYRQPGRSVKIGEIDLRHQR